MSNMNNFEDITPTFVSDSADQSDWILDYVKEVFHDPNNNVNVGLTPESVPADGYSTSSQTFNELPSCNAINDCQSVLQPSNDRAVVDSTFLQILNELDLRLEAPCNIQQENPAHYQPTLDDQEAGPSKQQSLGNPQLQPIYQQPPPAFDEQMAEEPTVQEYNSTPTIDQSNMSNNEPHFIIQGENGPIPIRVSMINGYTYQLDIVKPAVPPKRTAHERRTAHLNKVREGQFRCEFCDATYEKQNHLTQHVKWKHEKASHKCSKCGKNFQTTEKLKQHMLHHETMDKPFKCGIITCGKRYMYSTDLKRHMQIHFGKRFVCDQLGCTKSFARKDQLETHRVSRVHIKKKTQRRAED